MHLAAARALFEQDVSKLSSELCRRRGWTLHDTAFPSIDCSFNEKSRTILRVMLLCDDWNDQPPSISLRASDGALLTKLLSNPTGVFNPGAHPQTGLPFVCMRGAREYHTHPSHVGDRWESLKDNDRYTLGGILTQLWNAWQKGRE